MNIWLLINVYILLAPAWLIRWVCQVVVDAGTGSGILDVWSAQASARKVYAVEATNVAEHARELVRANGVADIVEVIEQCSTDPCQPRNYFLACFVEDC